MNTKQIFLGYQNNFCYKTNSKQYRVYIYRKISEKNLVCFFEKNILCLRKDLRIYARSVCSGKIPLFIDCSWIHNKSLLSQKYPFISWMTLVYIIGLSSVKKSSYFLNDSCIYDRSFLSKKKSPLCLISLKISLSSFKKSPCLLNDPRIYDRFLLSLPLFLEWLSNIHDISLLSPLISWMTLVYMIYPSSVKKIPLFIEWPS